MSSKPPKDTNQDNNRDNSQEVTKRHAPGGMSLALLLTAWYTAASFAVVAVVTGLLFFGLANNLRRISEQSLIDEVDVCRALVRERGNDSDALREEVEIDSAVRRYQKFYVRVLDSKGSPLTVTPGMDRDLSLRRLAEAAATNPGIFRIDSPGGSLYRAMVATVPRNTSPGDVWTVQAAVDLTQEEEVLGHQRGWIWMVTAAALILCPGTGFLIARRGTRTLREVTETARHIGSSTLNERIDADSYPVEVRIMAETFNAMLSRLEDSFGRLSRFSADIAHELRNPVNNIRGEAEVALARARTPQEYVEALGSCLEEAVRLSEIIESLLFLARSENPGEHLKRTREDVGQMLNDLQDYYEAAAAETGVALTVSVPEGIVANVDRQLLQRALGNLVSNALAHCTAGGTVELRATEQDGQTCIEVHDTGTGIPDAALARVFDRFYRVDPARSRNSGGAGLGLSIVKQIAFLHGGEVKITSEPGHGTVARLVLPHYPTG